MLKITPIVKCNWCDFLLYNKEIGMNDLDIIEFFIDKKRNKIYEAKLSIKYLSNKAIEYKEYLDHRYSEPFDKYSEVISRIYHGIDVKPTCKICNKPLKFHSLKSPYGKWCSHQCQLRDPEFISWRSKTIDYESSKKNRKKTCLEKYGNENYRNNEKRKQTCIERYGVEYAMQCEDIKTKNKQTNIDRYGVENVFQSETIKERCRQTKLSKYGDPNYKNIEKYKRTCKERYGVEWYLQSDNDNIKRGSIENLEKAKRTNLEKYGVEYYPQTDEWKEMNRKTCLQKYGVESYSSTVEYKEKSYKTKKENNSFNTSSIEAKLVDYFKDNGINFEYQYKSDLYPYMCDFYFPDTDVYVEIQGNWTHGGRPFNEKDSNGLDQLNLWKSKASKYYNIAINVWTKSDVEKRNRAKKNNIRFFEIFSTNFKYIISELKRNNIINEIHQNNNTGC